MSMFNSYMLNYQREHVISTTYIVQQYPSIEDLGVTENGGLQFWETQKHTVRMHVLFVFLGTQFQGKK